MSEPLEVRKIAGRVYLSKESTLFTSGTQDQWAEDQGKSSALWNEMIATMGKEWGYDVTTAEGMQLAADRILRAMGGIVEHLEATIPSEP